MKDDFYNRLPLSDYIEDIIGVLEYYKGSLNKQDLMLHNAIERLLEMRYAGIDIEVIKNEIERIQNMYMRVLNEGKRRI